MGSYIITKLSGLTIGKYEIGEKLGMGGMAIVYKAHHTDFNLPVAVKFLQTRLLEDENTRVRFRNEAKVQFKLRHGNIVRVLEMIEVEQLLGLSMDWIEGSDLHEHLEKSGGSLSFGEIKNLFLPILDAVSYAHSQGVIHRDLKPRNVMIEKIGDKLIPKVVDFGIAKILDEDGHLTETGTLLGTPHYMAPDQAHGKPDHRADIYSLGAILYQLLTGHLMFGDRSTALELIMAHISQEPPSVRHWVPSIPKEIEEITYKAIAKNPKDRFSTCVEFAEALQRALDKVLYEMSTQGTLDVMPLPSGELGGILEPPASVGLSTQSQDLHDGFLPSGALNSSGLDLEAPGDDAPKSAPTKKWALTAETPWAFIFGLLMIVGLSTTILWLLFTPSSKKPDDTRPSSLSKGSQTIASRGNPPDASLQTSHPIRTISRPDASGEASAPKTPTMPTKQPGTLSPVSPRTTAISQRGKIAPRPHSSPSLAVAPKGALSARALTTCLRCLKRHCEACDARSQEPALGALPGQGSEPNQACNKYAFVRLGRRCARACQRYYPTFCISYLKLIYRAYPQGPMMPARKIPVCRAFTVSSSNLNQLKKVYSWANEKGAQFCHK